MRTIHYSDGNAVQSVIVVWDDLHTEACGRWYRAFWSSGPNGSTGSPVVGYCSAGGSWRTIRDVVREVRRLGYADPIYRNGRMVDDGASHPVDVLRHHVTGAIERGEAQPIEEVRASAKGGVA